jgi:hypothetical protein
MLDDTAEELIIGGQHGIHHQGFGGGEMECIEAFEAKSVQFDTALLDGGREGLER